MLSTAMHDLACRWRTATSQPRVGLCNGLSSLLSCSSELLRAFRESPR
jgi:hypothetical protein